MEFIKQNGMIKPFRILICGKQGSGKSYYAKNLIQNKDFKSENIIIFDTLHEYHFADFLECQSYGEFESIIEKPEKLPKHIIFQPNRGEYGNLRNQFDMICDYVINSNRTIFLIEECDYFCNPYSFRQESERRSFKEIIEYGRHQNISLICITRRIKNCSRDLSANMQYIVAFSTTELGDKKELIQLGFRDEEIENISYNDHDYLELDL